MSVRKMLKECYVQLLLAAAAAAALRWSIYRVGRVSLLLRLDILTASVHPIIQSSNHETDDGSVSTAASKYLVCCCCAFRDER